MGNFFCSSISTNGGYTMRLQFAAQINTEEMSAQIQRPGNNTVYHAMTDASMRRLVDLAVANGLQCFPIRNYAGATNMVVYARRERGN
jgi:hypothetical protein